MAYQALYRKYRPQTFAEVYGQKAVKRTLENALKEGKISHAYLFCGPRGTGKTSMSRLLAKALNCKEGLGAQCCKCDSCLAIASGNHPDVIEMDAASNSRVEDVRDLISQVNYQPIMGRYKVYIIDEVHNMSGSAFNALLKTLEEPPANVVFILATTEPQKIPPTILSRVQRFDFSKVDEPDLIANMEMILAKENDRYEPKALEKIAELADGGVRDALSLLDQAVSFGGDNVTARDVESLFGLIDADSIRELVELAHRGDLSTLVSKARGYYARGMDVVRATKDMVEIYKDLLIRHAGGKKDLLRVLTETQADALGSIGIGECERDVAVLTKTQRDYRYSQDIMDTFELGLIQLAEKDMAGSASPAGRESSYATVAKSSPVSVEKRKAAVVTASAAEPALKPADTSGGDIEKKPTGPKPRPAAQAEATSDNVTDDQVLNLMIQGDKGRKTKLAADWAKLVADDQSQSKAVAILKTGDPVVANEKGLILMTFTDAEARVINNSPERGKMKEVLKKSFGFAPDIAAISGTRFNGLVEEFKNKMQANTLPEAGPIAFFGKPQAGKKTVAKDAGLTNAARFLAELENSGGK